jgi:mannan endo-1,4-beta-mannosidase
MAQKLFLHPEGYYLSKVLYNSRTIDMRRFLLVILLAVSGLMTGCSASGQLRDYITVNKDRLMDGKKEFRFVSYNVPNMAYIEDFLPFDDSNPWRLPTEFEIRDALKTIKMDGGKVARIYTLSVRREGESKNIIRYIEGPGQFNEKAFEALDKVLQIANEEGVRLIIPFVDNWFWWGGVAEYASFRGKRPKDFWTDPQLISDFEKTINFVLNRKNTFTGVRYKDDKAVLGWETGNELEAPLSWQNTIAAYIKSIDKNHLVLEGTFTQLLTAQEVADTNFDVLSTHYYTSIDNAVGDALANRALTKNKKPYFIGEFGFRNPEDADSLVNTVIDNGISGIMIWSLRSRTRDGGFYQHGENYGVGSYRFPGFPSDSIYHEKEIMEMMRRAAYAIDSLPEPSLPIPDPPNMLAIKDVYHISWQGSVGATSYAIQRRDADNGQWDTIADSVSEVVGTFRPLFEDTTAELGKSYFYRAIAENQSGSSAPSNEIGPVENDCKELIDELDDSTKIFAMSDSLSFLKYQDSYRAKNDFNRLKGTAGSYVIYRVRQSIDSIRVEAFLTNAEVTGSQCGLDFFASDSIETMKPINVKVETFPMYRNFYRFFTPAIYTWSDFPPNSRYLKIRFDDATQLSRVEIIYSKVEKPNPNIVTVQ